MQFRISKSGLYPVILVMALLLCSCKSKDYEVIQSTQSSVQDVDNDDTYLNDDYQTDLTANAEISVDDSVSDALSTGTDLEEVCITVYVCGAVNNCGVYEFSKGARIADAVNAAGGFSDDADREYLNLAMTISDGMKIKVPTIKEVQELNAAEDSSMQTGDKTTTNSDAFVVTGDGTAVDGTSDNSTESSESIAQSNTGLVNINTAGVDELCTLSGIGKSRAEAIISYREQNGSFNCIEDIMKVTGIKDKIFEQIKDSITV